MKKHHHEHHHEIDEKAVTNEQRDPDIGVHHSRLKEDTDPTLIKPDQTIYEALEERNLLKHGSHTAITGAIGAHRVSEHHLGMMRSSEKYYFLAPGYHFVGPNSHFIGHVSIAEPVIRLREGKDETSISQVTIVTVSQGNLGLSHKNGITRILEPGVHILEAPHHYEGTKGANEPYINLGTYHRILVAANQVAMAFDGKNTMIIGHEKVFLVSDEFEKKGKHKLIDVTNKYKIGGIFEIISDTFTFDLDTGFKSLQILEHKIKKLMFTTADSSYSGNVSAIVKYRISDPYAAFVTVQDVHNDVRRQAEAALSDILRRLTVDQLSLIPPSSLDDRGGTRELMRDPTDGLRGANESYAAWIAEKFHSELESVVEAWGVSNINVRILSLKPTKETKSALESRAKARMDAQTGASLVQTKTATAVASAERDRQVQVVNAQAAAESSAKQAEGEANVLLIRARAKAQIKLTEVEAEAQATIKRAESEAEAIKLRARAENEALIMRIEAGNKAAKLRAVVYKEMGLTAEQMASLEETHLRVKIAESLSASSTIVVPVDYGLGGNSSSQLASQFGLFQHLSNSKQSHLYRAEAAIKDETVASNDDALGEHETPTASSSHHKKSK